MLDLAKAIDVELKIEDIDRSHRLGLRPSTSSSKLRTLIEAIALENQVLKRPQDPSRETLLSSLLLIGCVKRFINQEHLPKKEIIEESL